jgi:hypothetical protein
MCVLKPSGRFGTMSQPDLWKLGDAVGESAWAQWHDETDRLARERLRWNKEVQIEPDGPTRFSPVEILRVLLEAHWVASDWDPAYNQVLQNCWWYVYACSMLLQEGLGKYAGNVHTSLVLTDT